VATDNGDETDFDDFRKPRSRTFNGWAQVVVRTLPGGKGELKVRAESAGLAAALAAVNVKK
jgi:beta-galactosidase